MKYLNHYSETTSYTTKDGSIIKELIHPESHGNHNQSLAEAIIPAHTETMLHQHLTSEEIYHITHGKGEMTLDKETFCVKAGDSIYIPPATAHKIRNTDNCELRILCCCSPAYSHEDTELL